MDEQLTNRMEELWELLQVLTEDAIALESFCLSEDRCRVDFSPGSCAGYLRRVDNYIEQHLTDLRQVMGLLIKTSRERLGALGKGRRRVACPSANLPVWFEGCPAVLAEVLSFLRGPVRQWLFSDWK